MSRRVAVYGGSFNPPHMGHVLAVAYTLAAQPVDEVLMVPCFQHPFSKELAPFEEQVRSAAASAVAALGRLA